MNSLPNNRWILTQDQIKSGQATDIYLERISGILASSGVDPLIRAEVRAGQLPEGWDWAILAGVEEVADLFQGLDVEVSSIQEGTSFHRNEPVLAIDGHFSKFAVYETALLGLLCQASGIATKSARIRKLAQGRPVFSFGARRMHPAISPMIDRAAFIGGCEGVAMATSAALLEEEPVGTMSHSLVMCFGDERAAFRAFDEHMDREVPRIALVDTLSDEKFGALAAAEVFAEKLEAVRLDTPGSRRGDFKEICKEVRWELDLRGYGHVRIMATGGIDEAEIISLNPVVDSYGVGTAISNAPVIDFSLDIVSVDGEPAAKRGKQSGGKTLWRCANDLHSDVTPRGSSPPKHCGKPMEEQIKPLVKDGNIVQMPDRPRVIRDRVLKQIDYLMLESDG